MNRLGILALRTRPLLMAAILAWGAVSVSGGGFKSGEYIPDWMLLGPIPVGGVAGGDAEGMVLASIEVQRAAFQRDYLLSEGGETNQTFRPGEGVLVGERPFSWRGGVAQSDSVDVGESLKFVNQSVGYAWTEVVTGAVTNAILSVGSDDAVKVWLNGEVKLEKWARRPMIADDDLVSVRLNKGTNFLLMKFQAGRECRFALRFLDRVEAGRMMVEASARGELERVRELLVHGASLDAVSSAGLTAVMTARIHGYEALVDFLEANGADASESRPPAGRLINGLMNRVISPSEPGAAVLVSRYGKVVFERGYGLASIEHGAPITPSTVFRIADLTMGFTAAGVQILEEEGKIQLTDSVSKYFPVFTPERGIQLRHLLNHTSGLNHFPLGETGGYQGSGDDILEMVAAQPAGFEVGTNLRYSNAGYLVLGHLLSDVSELSFEDYLRTRIFFQAGMTNTAVIGLQDVVRGAASGYLYEGGNYKRALPEENSVSGGAGALSSTVGDLHLWSEAFFGGELMTRGSLKRALTPVRVGDMKFGYGIGWFLKQLRGLELVYHGGQVDGFSSYLAHFPNQKLTIVILANASPSPEGLVPANLAEEIAQIFLFEEMESR